MRHAASSAADPGDWLATISAGPDPGGRAEIVQRASKPVVVRVS
jgi:hypothetical protein